MAEKVFNLIAVDIRKWDLELQKIYLQSYLVSGDAEEVLHFDVTLLPPPEMVEEFLGKMRKSLASRAGGEGLEETPEIELDNETFIRQKLYNYFKRIHQELNNPRRKKGQPKMIYSTHLDIYSENQDISFLPRTLQFYVVLNWARKYYEKEDYKHAIEPLRRLIKLNPEYGLGYKWLARSLKKIRKYDEAMKMYQKYADVDGSLDSLLDLAKSLRKGKIFDRSEKIYHQILEQYPGEKEARIGLAQIKYARKEPDYVQILDELYQEDPDWLREWLVEEFNFRIYLPNKTYLSPPMAAKFLGFQRIIDLTQLAFKNDIPSHFNPVKAKLSFFREELENWAFCMNRYKCLPNEIKLYPEALAEVNNGSAENDQSARPEAAPATGPGGRKLTKVEEILMKIRARKQERLAAQQSAEMDGNAAQASSGEASEEPPKRRRGRPRKSETQSNAETAENTAEAASSEATEEPPKRRRGRPRKSETQAAEAATSSNSTKEQADADGAQPAKRKRGRPRKNPLPEEQPQVQGSNEDSENTVSEGENNGQVKASVDGGDSQPVAEDSGKSVVA
ncbi:MAG: hypothetical protein D6715_04125 [Calditrichaeota bacterium]|nr:MAG: hypothetical protein D6715_04125 [Calditrichota bacterium]